MKEHLNTCVFAFAASYIALYWGCIIHKKRLFMCSKNDSAHAYYILNQFYFNKKCLNVHWKAQKATLDFNVFNGIPEKVPTGIPKNILNEKLDKPCIKYIFCSVHGAAVGSDTREFNVCWTFRRPRWPVKPRSTSSRPRSSRNSHVPGPAKTQVRQRAKHKCVLLFDS